MERSKRYGYPDGDVKGGPRRAVGRARREEADVAVQPKSERVTIYDVARHAGVSKSLVSLVLRGSEQVSAARREAVERSIAELGYRPSRAAAALAGQRSNTIGVVIDDFANPWFVELLAGLREGLSGTRFHVGVADAALNAHLRESPVSGYLAARVDGLLIAAEPQEPPPVETAGAPRTPAPVSGVGVPTVLVGHRDRGVEGADRVAADEAAGARLAVDHLRELGHRRIAFVSGDSGPARERARGYREAMAAAGLAAMQSRPLDADDRGGYLATRALLAGQPHLTAIVAANDLMALGAWQALRERGRDVPGDVSLVGYDDTTIAATGLIGLTSVDPRSAEIGCLAARALLARIDDPARPPADVVVDPRLVVRTTTGSPR